MSQEKTEGAVEVGVKGGMVVIHIPAQDLEIHLALPTALQFLKRVAEGCEVILEQEKKAWN